MKAKIVLLPGDGIGPEVVGEARRVLDHLAHQGGHTFTYSEHLIGGASIDKFQSGVCIRDATLRRGSRCGRLCWWLCNR